MDSLVATILTELLDLAVRTTTADKKENEKYIGLRTQLRKQVVAAAKQGLVREVDLTKFDDDGDILECTELEEQEEEAEESRNGTPTPTPPNRPDSPGTPARPK